MIWLVARITRKHVIAISMAFLAIILTWGLRPPATIHVSKIPPPDPRQWLKTAMESRVRALLTGDSSSMTPFYDQSLYGRWALEHEFRRVKYVKSWTDKRGIRFTQARVALQIPSVEPEGDTVWLYLKLVTTIQYTYKGDPQGATNSFRIGTRHSIQLVQSKGSWLIRRDWYTDPLDEDTLIPDVAPADQPAGSLPKAITPPAFASGQKRDGASGPQRDPDAAESNGRYNRRAAVAYAERYWHEYNPRYKNYTNLGGDCTNFVSQVLGDPEGGGLPMDYGKQLPGKKATRTWTLTDSLSDFLFTSGKARRLMRGTYAEVVQPTPEYPLGVIQELNAGDLIGYEEAGSLEHFAVVVGRDSRGYLLVNSHTADRYHAPWDLGWDRKTVFWLVQIVD